MYENCGQKTFACQVKVLTIGGSTVTVPHQPAPYSAYGASMDEANGWVYFVRSTSFCGLFVELDRWQLGGSTTTIYDLPEGIDAGSTSLAPDVTTLSDTDLLFSQWDCLASNSDIYQIESANTLSARRLVPDASGPSSSTGSGAFPLARQRAAIGGGTPPG